MAKYKTCPKCQGKNSWLADRCEHCNADIKNVKVEEVGEPSASVSPGKTPAAPQEREYSALGTYLTFLGVLTIIGAVIGGIVCVVNFSHVNQIVGTYITSTKSVFTWAGILYGTAFVFGGLVVSAVMFALAKLVDQR